MSWEHWDEYAQSVDPEGYCEYKESERKRKREELKRNDTLILGSLENRFGVFVPGALCNWPHDADTIIDVIEGAGIRCGGAVWLRNVFARLGIDHAITGTTALAIPMDIENSARSWLDANLYKPAYNQYSRVLLDSVDIALGNHFDKIGRMDWANQMSQRKLAQILRARGCTLKRAAMGMAIIGHELRKSTLHRNTSI